MLSADELRSVARARVVRLVGYVVGVLGVVLVATLVGVQWFRPVPAPVFRSAGSLSVRLRGAAPSLPWPTTGAAALSVEGVGSLGQVGSTRPAPIPGLAEVMTAYVVLLDHPLAPGAPGPAIPVTQATIAAYQTGVATQEAVVPVAAGETLSELAALEGMLVAGGGDLAILLADWDEGSTVAFVTQMNTIAKTLGLDATHFNDPSGLDPGSVSTPADLIRLGEAAMAIRAFAQVVALPQVTLPLVGVVYNLDYDLGQDGIVGIKTGSDAAAGGCFLFAAQRMVGGKSVTLVGAVLGQQTISPTAAAVDGGDALVKTAFSAIGMVSPVRPAQVLGRIVAPWGPSVPVTAAQSPGIVGWPGLTVRFHVHLGALSSAISSGTPVGLLRVDLGDQKVDVVLRTARRLPGPSVIWRLTRL